MQSESDMIPEFPTSLIKSKQNFYKNEIVFIVLKLIKVMEFRFKLMQTYYNNLEYDEIGYQELNITDYEDNSIALEIDSMEQLNLIRENLILSVQKAIGLVRSKLLRYARDTDSISTILNYLEYILAELAYMNMEENYSNIVSSSKLNKDSLYILFTNIWNAIYTLFNIFANNEIQVFLHVAIIESTYLKNDNCYKRIREDNYKELYSCQFIEIIIFKDADLYAAVNQLKLIGSRFNKIWIQEPVRAKFVWILRKCFQRTFRRFIHVFRTKEELRIPSQTHKVNIVSIWSEDILIAKNLAMSLKNDITFINTHMDFSADVVLLPYNKILSEPLYESILQNAMQTLNTDIIEQPIELTDNLKEHKGPIYYLYYNGTWQKPVTGKYRICDDYLWAHVTIEDVHKCIDSAKKGFEIWSTWSSDSRIEILSKLASILEYKGKSSLSEVVLSCVRLSTANEWDILQYGKFDVTTFNEPRGVIVLTYNDDISLFRQLISSLVLGNSVIIMCDKFSPTVLPWYYDTFSISQIPPGVINVLFCANVSDIDSHCLEKSKNIILYTTRQKKVILPLE